MRGDAPRSAKCRGMSRNPISHLVDKNEKGAFDDDVHAADLIQEDNPDRRRQSFIETRLPFNLIEAADDASARRRANRPGPIFRLRPIGQEDPVL